MQTNLSRTAMPLLAGLILSGCDLSRFAGGEQEATFRAQITGLSQRVYQLRLDAAGLPGKEDAADLAQLETGASRIAAEISTMLAQADPLRKPQLELINKHWLITTRHLREYHLREQSYKTFLQQRATLNTQLAVFTDGIDKLAVMVVQARAKPEVVYRTTGMLYINERMQHSITLLTDRSNDTPLLMERFSRDLLLLKSYLTDLRAEFGKMGNKRQAKPLLEQLQRLQDEFIRNGLLMDEVMQTSSDYLDFIERHNNLQEQLAQMSEYLEQLQNPTQQAGT